VKVLRLGLLLALLCAGCAGGHTVMSASERQVYAGQAQLELLGLLQGKTFVPIDRGPGIQSEPKQRIEHVTRHIKDRRFIVIAPDLLGRRVNWRQVVDQASPNCPNSRLDLLETSDLDHLYDGMHSEIYYLKATDSSIEWIGLLIRYYPEVARSWFAINSYFYAYPPSACELGRTKVIYLKTNGQPLGNEVLGRTRFAELVLIDGQYYFLRVTTFPLTTPRFPAERLVLSPLPQGTTDDIFLELRAE
jgi:hypothetical protein